MTLLTPKVPDRIVESWLDATVGGWEAVGRATVEYWAGAWRRGATPLDVTTDLWRWYATASRRERPQWAHEHRLVREWPIARLRDYSTDDADPEQVPTLLLPPQAGHDSCIVDYAEGQSQILTARESGCTRVLALDWVGATRETRDAGIDDYIDVLREAIEGLGGRANLVGDCQGGWLATIFTALHPELVHSLTIAGAPIDFHAGEPLIHDWVRYLTPGEDLSFYRSVVAANDGVLPGSFLLGGFIGMQLNKELDRQLQLLAHLHEPDYVQRYRTFETWFQWTQALPGTFYLWVVEHLFQKNELIQGTLEVKGQLVDLGRIECPLFLMAGRTDHITPPPQVWALADYVSTDPDKVGRQISDGGHLGLFMGHEALANHWPVVFGQIAELSRPGRELAGVRDQASRPPARPAKRQTRN
ncbi:alpha/beta hydrolase [Naumannella sp. ID2617S]|nr:alpha/beta hydrolase [Naumannella sp. ID2617S]